MDWTDETIARLRSLWEEGHSTAEIGRRLGITKNAVVGKAHRLMLPARPSPIRRAEGQGRPPQRTAIRRVIEATLPLVVPVAPAPQAAEPVAPAQPSRREPLLRAVPSLPRPSGRVSACCWPIGDPGTPSFRFCSDTSAAGKPYCAQHASIAYVKVRDRKEDAA